MRSRSLVLVLALASVPTLAGCLELFCNVEKIPRWEGDTITDPQVSAAGDHALVLWQEGGSFHTAAIVDGEVRNEHEHGRLYPWRIASAPAGHILLVGEHSLSAWRIDVDGTPAASSVRVSSDPVAGASAVFDGANFLIAWLEGDAMKLTSIAPGGDQTSEPITIGPRSSAERIVMASSDGVTWIAWTEKGRAVGVRVTSSGAIDPAPVVLLQDPRIGPRTRCSLAGSNGRFLLAVSATHPIDQLLALVPFDDPQHLGTTVELPNTGIRTLAGSPYGFAFLRGWEWEVVDWRTPKDFVIVQLAQDGTYLGESVFSSMGAGLASDGRQLLVTLVNNRQGDNWGGGNTLGEDEAVSVLSLQAVDGGGRTEIARSTLERFMDKRCKQELVK